MPPRTPQKRPQISKTRGSDPTVGIAAASQAKTSFISEGKLIQEAPQEPMQQAKEQKPQANDDLKKLIETLKNKLGGTTNNPPQKQVPPQPTQKTTWNRSITNKENQGANWKPAYTVLTRISNHEKIPVKSNKASEITINSVPHSFIYRPGVDGIKVDKLDIKSGKQIGIG